MSSIWIPGLAVLAVGLAAGIFAALRLGRRGGAPEAEDLRLRIADLEARRDDLYRRIRQLSPDAVESGEKAALELAAARVLRDLDAERGRLGRSEEPAEEPAEAAAAPAGGAPPSARRYPALVGFLSGAVAVGAIALLVYWAGRDATPGPPPPPQPGGLQQAQGELPPDHPDISGEIPAATRERIDELTARVDGDPEDLMARKELALLQLSAGQYMESFRRAQEVLERQPDDPDALFAQGVVRVLMGNSEQALTLLDRVLARFPDHLQALLYRGVALYQSGQTERAVDSWQIGLEMAGGSHPEFERLLEMARTDAAAAPDLPAPEPAVATAPPAPEPAAEESGYRLRIELAPGARAEPDAALFVILRGSDAGPPAAVRKVSAPRFPLELVLGSGDSMMGAELPASGFLTVRLDADGNASTVVEGDLAAETEASAGSLTTLVLGG